MEPDSLAAKRLSARLLAAKGDFDGALKELRSIAEDGRATTEDLNLFAWAALFVTSVPADAVEAAERANTLTQERNFAILHTLACVYAELGKPVEARNLLTKALETSHLAEPNSALWYGLGRLAELYGQPDAAVAIYKRVESPEGETTDAFATYNLVQARIRQLAKKFPKEVRAGS
jgi:tetratricopeptide (TPR) repeat protein